MKKADASGLSNDSQRGALRQRSTTVTDKDDVLITQTTKSFTKGKTVKFAATNEAQDVTGKKVVTIAKTGETIRRTADSIFGGGSALSKSAHKRRRMWRKIMMRLNPRYWIHVLNKKLPIIHPDDKKRRYWDLFVLLLVIYNAIMVPFEVGYGKIEIEGLDIMDYVIDAIFWCDILYNFRTAYMDHSANLVRDGRKIAQHYLRTWFPIDLPASIPFDSIVLAFTSNVSQNTLIALSLLRTPRLLRLGRLLRFFDRMKGANVIRMVRLLFFMALVAHWVCCLWYMIYRLTASTLTWSFDSLAGSSTITMFLNAYLQSFLLMIGNDVGPLNNLERLYCTGILVIGACFYAIVVGHMSLLVNNMNPTASRHKFKKDIINNTIRYLGTPSDIASRVDEYFDYLTTYSHPGPDGMALISQLPSSMFQDVAIWMYKDLVTKVPLFKECEEAFITQLVMRLKMAVFMPGEVIFRIGDVGHEMYFITKGHVAVMNDRTEMLSILGKGGFFGELALLATSRRTAQCVALSHCDLSLLMAHDLVGAMKDFPDSAEKVRAHAVKRLADLQTAGNVAQESFAHPAPRHLKKLNPTAAAEQADMAAFPVPPPSSSPPPAGVPGQAGDDGGQEAPGAEGPSSASASPEPWNRAKGGGPGMPSLPDYDHGSTSELALGKDTLALVAQVQSTIQRLTIKIEMLHGKMGGIHMRLGRVEAAGGLFGGSAGADMGGKGGFFDMDFHNNM